MADLRYNIEDRSLNGKIGDTHISAYAGSGGRAGSKAKDAENWWLANNSLATHVGGAKAKGTHSYGPIPRGLYTLRLHESRKNWIRLVPDASNVMFGRSGFAIHGRGQTGSHGCLVTTDFNVVLLLCKLLVEHEKAKGAPVTLEVVSIGQNIGKQFVTA
jgi:hypothetical protein